MIFIETIITNDGEEVKICTKQDLKEEVKKEKPER